MKYYLAIDIGASSGRHILGCLKEGKLCYEEIYRFSNSAKEVDNNLVWDTDLLFSEIINGLKVCKELNKIPVSIGIDTWGVDYVLLNENKEKIEPVFCYRDSRTDNANKEDPSFEELYKVTGTAFNKFNTIYQLLCDKKNGRLDNASHLLMIPEYFSFLLTGEMGREYTNASTTGLLNCRTRDWDNDLLDKLAFPSHLFPSVVPAGTLLGPFTEEIQSLVGFASQVILPATHDTGSAVVAARSGIPYISSGTWSLLGTVGEPVTSEEAYSSNYTNEGASNGDIRLLKNIMGLWIIQCVKKELNNEYSFADLANLAKNNAIFDWRIDINHESFFAPKNMIKAIQDRCIAEGVKVPETPGEIAHCVYNSLAYSYKEAIQDLENITGKKYKEMNIIGGGSNNTYLNELTAKATGLVIYTGPCEATALGNLLIQVQEMNKLSEEELEQLKIKSFEEEIRVYV